MFSNPLFYTPMSDFYWSVSKTSWCNIHHSNLTLTLKLFWGWNIKYTPKNYFQNKNETKNMKRSDKYFYNTRFKGGIQTTFKMLMMLCDTPKHLCMTTCVCSLHWYFTANSCWASFSFYCPLLSQTKLYNQCDNAEEKRKCNDPFKT